MPNFFNKYPYTDFHELNLDWLLNRMKQLEIDFDEFKVVNNITFSGQWDITKQYPAWTIVSNNNIGYVSIQPVPVGVTINNGNYWVEVIDYTAQIAGLQTRVINLENTVGDANSGLVKHTNDNTTAINENKSRLNDLALSGTIAIIGDSYLQGYTPDGPVTDWGTLFKSKIKKTNVVKYAYGGVGFVNTVDGKNFGNMVLDIHNDPNVDDDDVTLIIFGGGWNDHGYSYNNLETGIATAITNIETYFPNAQVCISFMAWDKHSGHSYTPQIKINFPAMLENACRNKNVFLLSNTYKCLQLGAYMSTDGFHPNATGQERLAEALYTGLVGTYTPTGLEQIELYSRLFVSADEDNIQLTIYRNYTASLVTPVASYVCNGATVLYSLNLNNNANFIIKPGGQFAAYAAKGFVRANNSFYAVDYVLDIIADGTLNIYAFAINDAHNNYLSLTNIDQIGIYGTEITIPRIVS